jgi:hypothetical protein
MWLWVNISDIFHDCVSGSKTVRNLEMVEIARIPARPSGLAGFITCDAIYYQYITLLLRAIPPAGEEESRLPFHVDTL